MLKRKIIVLFVLLFSLIIKVSAQDAFTGEIRMFAGNFAPKNWAFCDGQIMSIVENPALFSILGTTYGGNGITFFALPDLRGRVPIGPRLGPGLSDRGLGETGGAEKVTLNTTQMPAHAHPIQVSSAVGSTDNAAAAGVVPARNASATPSYSSADLTTNGSQTSNVGGSQPHENMPPYLGINFIICLNGIHPPRD